MSFIEKAMQNDYGRVGLCRQAGVESMEGRLLLILSQLNHVPQRHPLQFCPRWWPTLRQAGSVDSAVKMQLLKSTKCKVSSTYPFPSQIVVAVELPELCPSPPRIGYAYGFMYYEQKLRSVDLAHINFDRNIAFNFS